jgi:hypothetical protein
VQAEEEVNWVRRPDGAMWTLHIRMLRHAASLRPMAAGLAGSALNHASLIYLGDLGGRGSGMKPIRHYGPKK